MKPWAEVAAAFSVLVIPRGVSDEQAALGLLMNTERMRAMRLLEGAAASGLDEESAGALMKAAGIHPTTQIRTGVAAMRQRGQDRLRERAGR